MGVYRWFRSANQAQVERCFSLINKGFGMFQPGVDLFTAVRFRMDEEGEPTTPALYGTPVGAGGIAGNNRGAALVEQVRASVISGDNSTLTVAEQGELLLFFQADADIDDAWFYDLASPDYGLP